MQKSPQTKNKIICLLASTAMLGANVFAVGQTYALETPVAIVAESKENEKKLLDAAIQSAKTQFPDLELYITLGELTDNLSGHTSSMGVQPDGTISVGISPTQGYEELLAQATRVGISSDTLKDKTYSEVIALAENFSAYGTDTAFKAVVDSAKADYQALLGDLQTDLLRADQSLTGLDTKTEAELLSIYNNLPVVKDGKYRDIITSIEKAEAIDKAYGEGSVSREVLDRVASETYNELVDAAKIIKPDFEVKIPVIDNPDTESPDTTQPSGGSSAGTSSVPSAPNAGNVNSEETSAQGVKTAVTYIVVAVAVMGIAVNLRRYLFSPLKRRK